MKKRGIRMVSFLVAAAILLMAVIRIVLTRQDEKKEEQKRDLGEMLAAANKTQEEETEEEEEGVVTLCWAFTEVEAVSLEPYETALNDVLKKRGLPWRVSFDKLKDSATNGLEGPVSERRQLSQNEYDIVSCLDFGDFLLYGMLAREGLLEPLNTRMEGTEEGKRLKDAYPQIAWDAVSVGGNIYGIPTIFDTQKAYVILNGKMTEKYGIRPEEISGDNLAETLKFVTDREWEAGNTGFRGGEVLYWYNGGAQQTLSQFIQVSFSDGEPKVENVLENEGRLEERRGHVELLSDGYLFRGEWEEEKIVQSGNFFSLEVYSYCEEAAVKACRDRWKIPETVPLKAVEVSGQDTTFYGGAGKTGIWAAGEQKEEAFALLAAIYSDAELSNALTYGTFGRDYRIEDGIASVSRNQLWESYGGNALLTYPARGDSKDKRERLWEAIEAKRPETVPRFEFDPQKIIVEWTNLRQVEGEYWEDLCHCSREEMIEREKETGRRGVCGCMETWEEDVEKVRKAALDAGIDRVIEYMEELIEGRKAPEGEEGGT